MSSDSMAWGRLIRRFGSARDRASSVKLAVQEYADRATWVWLYSAIVWLTIVNLFGQLTLHRRFRAVINNDCMTAFAPDK